MAHIMRENAGREIKMISELFIIKNSEYTFVLFVSDQSLWSPDAYLIPSYLIATVHRASLPQIVDFYL